MKTLLAASFTALLLAGAAAANAANPDPPATSGATAVQAVSTPYTQSNRGSEALPVFNYQGAVPLTPTVGPSDSISPSGSNSVMPWNVDLAHQTGDGSR